jgi:hypothetical protein
LNQQLQESNTSDRIHSESTALNNKNNKKSQIKSKGFSTITAQESMTQSKAFETIQSYRNSPKLSQKSKASLLTQSKAYKLSQHFTA